MKLGTRTDIFEPYGENRYKKMKEFGFEYADFSIGGNLEGMTEEEYLEKYMKEKELADEAGVTIWQIHGPWRYPPHDETPELRAERAELMKRSIRVTAQIGCKYWVIHPFFPFGDCGFDMDSFWRINEEFFKNELVPYAKEYGITVCFENMPMKTVTMSTTEKSLEFIHKIGMDNIKLCLDTGHEAVFRLSPADAVRRAGKDLAVLHVHDNDGDTDRHWVPGSGVVDFYDFYKALKEIEFDGVFSLELDSPLEAVFLPGLSLDARFAALRAILADIMKD